MTRTRQNPEFLKEFKVFKVGSFDDTESEMPKLKTKRGTKKRFKLTASGKVKRGQTGKRHGMIKRTNKQIRNKRGTTIMADADAARVIKSFMPYA